jgi:hypothetical protein
MPHASMALLLGFREVKIVKKEEDRKFFSLPPHEGIIVNKQWGSSSHFADFVCKNTLVLMSGRLQRQQIGRRF